MRKISVIAVVAILLVVGVAGGLILIRPTAAGWSGTDLVSPMAIISDHPSNSIPGPSSNSYLAPQYGLEWRLSEVYATYGGVAWVSLNNTGSNSIFVYELSFQWSGTNISCTRQAMASIQPGEKVEVGILSFPAPTNAGHHLYSIHLKLAVEHPNGSWYDYGASSIASHDVLVLNKIPQANYTIYRNSANYFNRVNELVDYSVTAPIAQTIKGSFPGGYNLLQVVAGYEWVRRNIEYVADGPDYWQSANETLSLRTGDCEDYAILLASLVGELGGNARVNIIDGHAFPTVYIGDNVSVISSVRDSIASYYWVNASDLRLTYFIDGTGIWLIIDPVGKQYAGGLPSLSGPSTGISGGDSWAFESAAWCYWIDATGRTNGGWLPF